MNRAKVSRVQLVLALGLLAVAVGLALLRWTHLRMELPPTKLAFSELHNLDWSHETGTLTVTGPDPFGHVRLPGGARPLHAMVWTLQGPPLPGGWYVYPAPADRAQVEFDQAWVVTAVVENTTTSSHELRWDLPRSQELRIDLPDELSEPIRLRQLVFETRFAESSNPVFLWLVLTGGAGTLLLVGQFAGSWLNRRPVELAIVAALVALKVWLAASIGQTLFPGNVHDDALFLTQAESVRAGDWLGPFGELTLAKGPTFSVFVALSSLTGWPLQLNETLLHALAVGLFVWALAPWIRGAGWRLLLFAVLLFDPQSMSAEIIGRVLRGAIQPALTLLTLAGLLGLLTRTRRAPVQLVPWALLAGLAGGAFWYSREEGIWLAPTASLIWGTAVMWGWRTQTEQRARWLAFLLLPLVLFQGVKVGLRLVNQSHYGVPIGVDVSEGSFPAAYGALLRVDQPDPIPGVPLTVATRELIYPHSPTFAQLRPLLEGELTEIWGRGGWGRDGDHPRARLEIRGGWFQWALRDGAKRLGYYQSAEQAEEFWRAVAYEVNQAVDAGLLSGSGPRHGMFPRWHPAYSEAMPAAVTGAIDLLLHATDFKGQPILSRGAPEQLERFAGLVHAPAVTSAPAPDDRTAGRLLVWRLYAPLAATFTLVALVSTLWLLTRGRREIEARAQLAILLALWGGALALVLVCALVHVTSFYALIGPYLAPAVPLLMACWVLAPHWAFRPTEPDAL